MRLSSSLKRILKSSIMPETPYSSDLTSLKSAYAWLWSTSKTLPTSNHWCRIQPSLRWRITSHPKPTTCWLRSHWRLRIRLKTWSHNMQSCSQDRSGLRRALKKLTRPPMSTFSTSFQPSLIKSMKESRSWSWHCRPSKSHKLSKNKRSMLASYTDFSMNIVSCTNTLMYTWLRLQSCSAQLSRTVSSTMSCKALLWSSWSKLSVGTAKDSCSVLSSSKNS